MSIKYEILKPKQDLVFKLLFGSEHSYSILKSFLKAILNIEEEIEGIKLTDPYFKIDSIDDKVSILDIKLEMKNGEKINIEIQVKNIPDMSQRIVYYTSKMISEQLKTGHKYNEIKKVISIIILDYNMIKDSEAYHNSYLFRDEKNKSLLTDIIQIHTLELKKIPKEINDEEIEWLKFISSENEEEMDMLAQQNAGINEAFIKLKELSQDEETRIILEGIEKRRRDEESRIMGAREEGKLEGIEEGKIKGIEEGKIKGIEEGKIKGIEEGKIKGKLEGMEEALTGMVINLFELGSDTEYIARATKMSIQKIEELLGTIKK